MLIQVMCGITYNDLDVDGYDRFKVRLKITQESKMNKIPQKNNTNYTMTGATR